MKVTPRLFGLIVALSVGTAVAASPTGTAAGTTAGIGINNTATATFTDPTSPATPATVNSNTVTTTVNAVTGFDVLYQDGSTDDTASTAPATSYDKADAVPGGTVQTKYTVVNNSNINNYVINLAPVVSTVNAVGGTVSLAASDVQYFAVDTNGIKTGPALSKVTLAVGGAQDIVQVITIPTTGVKAGDKFSASPQGTAPASTDTTAYSTAPAVAFAQYLEASNQNNPPAAAVNGDLQYTRATVYTPNLTGTPVIPVNTTTVLPPTTANPGTPNNPVSPPNTPTDPTDPTKPGYTSPDPTNPSNPTPTTTPGTAVVVDVAGNNQTAYPPSGVTQVAFTNQVKNGNATTADTVRLFPSDGTLGSAPKVAPDANGKFTYTTAGGDLITVQFFGANGLPLPRDANNFPILPVAAGGTSQYFTVVTFPDQTLKADPASIVIAVGVSSGNKATSATPTADANTTDTILPPGLKFGDDVAGSPDATKVGPGNVAQVVNVSKAVTLTPILDAGVNTDRTAVFPMDIVNSGEYADTYILDSNKIDFQKVGGGVTTVPVKYYYNNGSVNLEITQKNTAGNYFTPVVAPNTTLKVYAVIDVPVDALATNGTLTNTLNGINGIDKDVTFNQKVTANYSGAVLTDNNDQITVLPVNTVIANGSGIAVDKYQGVGTAPLITPAGKLAQTALPKATLKYAIVVKNNFNAPVKNFILKELDGGAGSISNSINTYGDYQTINVTGYSGFTGTPVAYYSVDGGSNWTSAAPAIGAVTPTNGLQIYIDTDGTQVPTTFAPTVGDAIPANATFQVNIDIKVK